MKLVCIPLQISSVQDRLDEVRSFFSNKVKKKKNVDLLSQPTDVDERAEWSRVGRTWNRINARDYAPVSDVYLVCGFPAREIRTRAVANTVIIAWHARERVACAQWQRISAGGARESGQPWPFSPSTLLLSWIRFQKGELPQPWLERNWIKPVLVCNELEIE